MEFLVRCAECKYSSDKESEDLSMVLVKFFINFCDEHFKKGGYDQTVFREVRYWTEEIDFLYFTYEPLIKYFFDEFSGMKTLPGQKPFMCMEEFRMFLTSVKIDDKVSEREVPLIFNLSMMTQIDEQISTRNTEMSFVEFLEAIARLADICSFPSLKYTPKEVKIKKFLLKNRSQLLRNKR
jgi:hypothetical protein